MSESNENISTQNDNFIKSLEEIKRIDNIIEKYHLSLVKENTEKASLSFYADFFFMSAILEAFIVSKQLDLNKLQILTWKNVPQDIHWKVTMHSFHYSILKMVRLGYIEVSDSEKANLPTFRITELGIKTLQEQTLQNLASTNFFNYQARIFNKKSFLINLLAISVAIISLIVTILALK